MDVSRSGFYAWKARQGKSQPCRLLVSDKSIIREMKAFRKKHRFTPGVRQFHAYLKARQLHVGLKRLRRVLRHNGFIGYKRRSRVKTTDSNHRLGVLQWVSEKWTSRNHLGENDVQGGNHCDSCPSSIHC